MRASSDVQVDVPCICLLTRLLKEAVQCTCYTAGNRISSDTRRSSLVIDWTLDLLVCFLLAQGIKANLRFIASAYFLCGHFK